jgi:hypothetical protein
MRYRDGAFKLDLKLLAVVGYLSLECVGNRCLTTFYGIPSLGNSFDNKGFTNVQGYVRLEGVVLLYSGGYLIIGVIS